MHEDLDDDDFESSGPDMQRLREQLERLLESDPSDDDLFGASVAVEKRMIYNYGKQMLHKLSQAWDLGYKDAYDEINKEDVDALFNLVLQITGAEFKKAIVVDSVIREYTSMEGLHDFGWMLESGEFNTLTDAWKEFGQDTDVGSQDWFKAEMQTFMGSDGLTEADAELAEPPEPERKKTTQTKQKSKLDPNMFGPKADQPVAKVDPLDDLKKNAGVGKDKPTVDIKKASQADTLRATSKIAPTDDMRDMLSRMRDIDVDPDLAGYPEPEPPENLPSVDVNTQNLPAVAGQAIQAAGVQSPDFHQVANLPGNMSDQIRQLGKNLFGALTATPTKRIYVVANLGGQGPNTNQEVQAVAGFLKDHGEDLGPGNVDFDNVMPGYQANTHMFSAAGIRWMLVKDSAGQYIYCWPEEDSVDAGPRLSNDNDYKQLR